MPRQHSKGQAVRVGRLEDTLESFNAEMGVKMAKVLAEYHVQMVEPRLKRLEMPFWKRWWTDLRAKIKSRIVPLEQPEPTEAGEEESDEEETGDAT